MDTLRKFFGGLMVFAMLAAMVACTSTPITPTAVQNTGAATTKLPTVAPTIIPPTIAPTVIPPTIAPTASAPVEIVWAMQGAANELAGWQAMADAANVQLKDKNITIKIQKINTSNWDEYYAKITAQIAGGNVPDIGRIAESLMPQVISKNQVVELTPYLGELDMKQYFEGTFNNAGKQAGKVFGLPSGVYNMLLFYNKDMFDKKGIPYPSGDWKNPISLEEVTNLAKQFSKGEGANRTFGYAGNADIFMMGALAGQYIYKSDNTYQWTDAHTKAFELSNTMLNVDHSMPTPVDTKIMGGMDMFRAGRVAMIVEGTWWQQALRETKNFKVGIAAVPSVKGPSYSTAFIDNFVIWKGTKHEKEAWEALKAIFSKKGFDALAKTGTGGVPINRATLDTLESEFIGTIFTDQDRATFKSALDHTMSMPYNPNFQEVSQQTGSLEENWMVGKKTTQELVTELKTYLEKATKK